MASNGNPDMGFSLFECTEPDMLFAPHDRERDGVGFGSGRGGVAGSGAAAAAAVDPPPFGGGGTEKYGRSLEEQRRHLHPLPADRTVVRASGSCACSARLGGTVVDTTMRFEYYFNGGGAAGPRSGEASGNGSRASPCAPLRERHVCIACPLESGSIVVSVEIDVSSRL